MKQDDAETIALRALAWLGSDDDLLSTFLGASGMGHDDLRAQAGDPFVLAAVLDFVLMDDNWVRGFCESAGLKAETPWHARHALPGGQQVHWT